MPQLYRDFSPTQFDTRGLGLDDRQDWFVVGVSRTRDSGPLENSNYETALKLLREKDAQGDCVEDHRFGHWGPGWFEIILVAPSLESEVEAIEDALADYPVLDDSDLSERESEAMDEEWRAGAWRDFAKELIGAFDLREATREWLLDVPTVEQLRELYEAHSTGCDSYSEDSASFDVKGAAYRKDFTRTQLAQWMLDVRKASRAKDGDA